MVCAAAPVLIAGALTGLTGCASRDELAEPTAAATSVKQTSSGTTATVTATETASETASETSTSEKAPDCSPGAFPDMANPLGPAIVNACAGGFAHVAMPNSDAMAMYQWQGDSWASVGADSNYKSGSTAPCYTDSLLDSLGVPAEVRAEARLCSEEQQPQAQPTVSPLRDPSGATYLQNGIIVSAGLGEAVEDASYPACDGRNILILESVIDEGNPGATMGRIANHVLTQHPSGMDTRFTVPGQCPSLRAQVDGQNIYPVYLDFGSDQQAMCRAKAAYGGNGRVLLNRAEYVDPC